MKSIKIKYALIIILSLLNGTRAFSQNVLTLDSLLAKVEETYPDILKYEDRIKSAKARSEGSGSWMPPTFSAGATRFPYELSRMKDKMDPMNQSGLMFSVEQMIPNPSKLNAKEKYNRSLSQVQEKTAEWAKNTYKTEAKILFYNRLVNEKKMAKIEESEDLLELFISTAENRYTYNQAELSNIYTLKARLEEVENMKVMAEANIEEANIGINALLNRDLDYAFAIDTSVSIPDHMYLNSAPIAVKRGDIEAMENNIKSMELNKELMAAEKKPDFGLKLEHMQMFAMPNQFSVMGMITLPIAPWSSKMYKSEVKSMDHEIEAMKKEKESMQIMASRMAAEKLAMLKYELHHLQNYEGEIIPAYQKSLEANFIAYRQNTGNFSSLMNAWDMLLMKQLERLDSMEKVLRLRSEYEYEVGK